MSKYNVGDKFIVEIDSEVYEGDMANLSPKYYTLKGLSGLAIIEEEIDKLQKCETELSWDEAYNKGLEDVWELAKKLWHNDARTNDDIYGIEYFIDIVNEYTPQEALAKLEAYEKEQNEMKVGDVVTVCGEKRIVVGYLCGLEEYEVWMDGYGRPQRICKNEIKKTGKHIDIQSVLEQIKE